MQPDITVYYQDLRQRLDLPRFALGRLGLRNLKQRGSYWAGPCPLGHDSKHQDPFNVYQAADGWRYHCHSCGKSGDGVDLAQAVLSVGHAEARDIAAVEAGLEPLSRGTPEEQRAAQARRSEEEQVWVVLEKVTALCQAELQSSALAPLRAWITERWGLTEETILAGRLGYAPEDLLGRLRREGVTEDQALRAGVAVRTRKGAVRSWFFRRLVIPYLARERVVYLGARTVDLEGWETPEWGHPEQKYKNLLNPGERREVSPVLWRRPFNEVPQKGDALVLVEGQLDCLAVLQAGLPCVGLSTSQLTGRWLEWLRRLAKGYSRLVILADSEENGAGRRGALATAERLEAAGIVAGLVEVPRGDVAKEDPASWLKGLEASKREGALMELLGQARTALDLALEDLPGQGTAGWDEAAHAYVRRLAALPRLVQEGQLKALKERLALSAEQLRALRSHLQRSAKGAASDRHHLTDWGNAQRLIAAHGQDLRFCHELNKWLAWEGHRWRVDETGEIARRAKDVARRLHGEAQACEDEYVREEIRRHAMATEGQGRLEALVKCATSEPGVAIRIEELDRDPWLLTCSNGVVDLRTGELRPGQRADLCTKACRVAYDAMAQRDYWLECLELWTGGREGLVRFLQAAVGYSLTGITSAKALFICWGAGDNGKSTFVETLNAILGDYSATTPFDTLMAKKGQSSGIPNDIARLRGIRAIWASEPPRGSALAEDIVKRLTGGDTIAARYLHGEFFEFKPIGKIWLGTNHRPKVSGDRAMWRRLKLIPWDVQIPMDKQLSRHVVDERLQACAQGILAWAVEGAGIYEREGLLDVEEVRLAGDEYREEMDVLGQWISEHCIVMEQAAMTSSVGYKDYSEWCELQGETPWSPKAWGGGLREKGYKPDKVNRQRGWRGIGLLEPHQRYRETDGTDGDRCLGHIGGRTDATGTDGTDRSSGACARDTHDARIPLIPVETSASCARASDHVSHVSPRRADAVSSVPPICPHLSQPSQNTSYLTSFLGKEEK